MKNKIVFMILMFVCCGNVYAFPQDWPCNAFKLERYEENSDGYNIYIGQDGNYILKINVFWRADMKSDDCGTAGCSGTIRNIKTNQEETLHFFCEAENNANNAKCSIRTGEEYILQKAAENFYQADLCDSTYHKYVRIDECSGCMCVLHDSREQNGELDSYMGCKKHEDSLHCMTGNIYEEQYNPTGKSDNFKNCVGLTSF